MRFFIGLAVAAGLFFAGCDRSHVTSAPASTTSGVAQQYQEAMEGLTLALETGNTKQAAESAEVVVKLREQISTTEYNDLDYTLMAGMLFRYGDKAIKESDVPLAARLLDVGMALDPRATSVDSPLLLRAFNDGAALAYTLGRPSAAIDYTQRAVVISNSLLTSDDRKVRQDAAVNLINVSAMIQSLGQLDESVALAERAHQTLADLFPDGNDMVVKSLIAWGDALKERGRLVEAEAKFFAARDMSLQLSPGDSDDLVDCFNNLGLMASAKGDSQSAYEYHKSAIDMHLRLHEKETPDTPLLFMGLSQAYESLGQLRNAKETIDRAIQSHEQLFAGDHPARIALLDRKALLLGALGDHSGDRAAQDAAYAMAIRLYPADRFPDGSSPLANAINNQAFALINSGEFHRGLALHQHALSMRKAVFKGVDHAEVATSLNNVGFSLSRTGDLEQSLDFYEQALAMRERLYPKQVFPKGHHEIAESLSNVGTAWGNLGKYDRELEFARRALEMRQAVFPSDKYPLGHEDLARSLNNVGNALAELGQLEQALEYHEQALDMRQRLYPRSATGIGHPDVVQSLINLSQTLDALGKHDVAYERLKPMVEEQTAIVDRFAATTVEAEALNYLAKQSRGRDALLQVSKGLTSIEREVYSQVWKNKSVVMRALERRRRLWRSSQDAEVAVLRGRLREVTAEMESLIYRGGSETGDSLSRLAEERERFERDLLQRVAPNVVPLPAEQNPNALMAAMPKSHVVIDFVRYADAARVGNYVAFVLSYERGVQRVELGSSDAIEDALHEFVAEMRGEGTATGAGKTLYEILWKPIQTQLPAGIRRLYIVPDGMLSQLPWAALPTSTENDILLDHYAVAMLPHAEFLLRPSGAVTSDHPLVMVGDVAFARFEPLKATVHEVDGITALFTGPAPVVLRQKDATTERLQHELVGARYAHLATHAGYLDVNASGLAERSDAAARNPLLRSGLIMAGDDVLTADAIAQLPLETLELAVLSACDSALGDTVEGEGVFSLQQAFHFGGAHNVVASLWKVDDSQTAALMMLFYKFHWIDKMAPVDALRSAQLTLWQNPSLVDQLVAQPAEAAKIVALRDVSLDPQPLAQTKNPTTQPATAISAPRRSQLNWAAFTISGRGE